MEYLFARRLSLEQFVAMRRFRAFDGVRALAAVMVILWHFAGPPLAFLSGWLGVHLFFVLSGFLITTLLVREEAEHGRVSLGDFWIRRVFRILPAYFVVLIATVGTIVLQNQATEVGLAQSIGWFVTVNPDLAPTPMGFYPAWTIGIEQRFYIVWPALAFVAVVGAGRRRFAVWGVALAVLVALAVFVDDSFVHYVVILLGCGAALAMHSPRLFPVISVLSNRAAASVALVALAAVQLTAGVARGAFESEVPTILGFGLFAALALPGLIASGPVAHVLSWRPLAWLGDRSYSLYLVQVLAAGVIASLFPAREGPWFLLLTLGVAIVMADVLHRWVELPGIGLGRKWTHERKARRTVPAVTREELEGPESPTGAQGTPPQIA